MSHIAIQKQIVEVAHLRGFTVKDLAVLSWRAGKNFSLGDLTTGNLEKVLEMVKNEKCRPTLSEEEVFDQMCKCSKYHTIYDEAQDHKKSCAWRRYLELETA